MKLLSINVGAGKNLEGAETERKTGIYKNPVRGLVAITRDGLAGDAICDTKHHGGADQAIYIYSQPDYEWWSGELGRELSPGTFGENLTFADLESSTASIGDRIHVGSVVLEVSAPRIPCETFACRMSDPSFVKRFRKAERPGLYCRVLQEGHVQAGDRAEYKPHPGTTITALEMFRDFYIARPDETTLRRHLAAPIAIRDRTMVEEKLAALLAR